MKKKISAIIICAALALSLTGCGTPEESETSNENNSSSSSHNSTSSSTSSSKPASSSSSKPGKYDDSIATSAESFEYEEENGKIKITKYIGTDEKVIIPHKIDGKPVTAIGKEAFDGCKSLTDVTIPDSVTTINFRAFRNCGLLTSITIPDSVATIETDAFFDCVSLTSVSIPDSVTDIGRDILGGTAWLKNRQKENPLVIVNGILIDGTTCNGSVIIPKEVTRINYFCFLYSSITSITIPDSVTEISNFAFYKCTSLTSVTIPDSVTAIGEAAFDECKCDITYKSKTYTPEEYNDLYKLFER